jgi:hypothetical protein
LFVASQGFTPGFYDELKRLSRDSFTVVPLELEKLHDFIDGGSSLSDWLASLISMVH